MSTPIGEHAALHVPTHSRAPEVGREIVGPSRAGRRCRLRPHFGRGQAESREHRRSQSQRPHALDSSRLAAVSGSVAHLTSTVTFGIRPVKRDFASDPMASTTGVPRSMPTSAVSSAEKMPGCVTLDSSLANLLAVNEQRPLAALRRAAAVIVELEHHRGLAGRELLRGGDREALEAKEVVVVRRHAVFDVERPAAEAPALRDHRAVAAARGHFDLRRDHLGAVLHVDEDGLHHAGHALRERHRRPPAHEIRSADRLRVKPLEDTVVEGQHVVLARLP